MTKVNHNCDNVNCNHNNTKGLCCLHNPDNCKYRQLQKENAELKEKISVLLSCKNCPENKGGLICQKEYENKCLAQKIEFIKELQKENAKLKRIVKMVAMINKGIYTNEGIKTIYAEAEQFLSEVEK